MVLEDAIVPLDNNPAERALRGLVVGRKHHHGSRSQRGSQVSALFYSLIGTARFCGADPAGYLRQAIEVPFASRARSLSSSSAWSLSSTCCAGASDHPAGHSAEAALRRTWNRIAGTRLPLIRRNSPAIRPSRTAPAATTMPASR